jgi:hypothetical protein
MNRTARTLRALSDAGELDLAMPGGGHTASRHLSLYELARRHPVSLARLAEAHTDGVAILCEAGIDPRPGALYGVWASSGPRDVVLDASALEVSGTKPFCSGAGIVDRALLTVTDTDRGPLLADIDARPAPTLSYDTSGWLADALSDTATGVAAFDRHPVSRSAVGRETGWYLDRPGFWYGACGPAACWAGGASGLVDAASHLIDDDPHRRADLGAMRAAQWAMASALITAGDEIDKLAGANGRRVALSLRHTIERLATEVLDRFGQTLGPRPFVTDRELGARWADTHLYLRQHHGARDLAELGRLP